MTDLSRYANALIAALVVAAVAVSIATAVRIVTLPEAGSLRHAAGARGSPLDDLRASLTALGIVQVDGAIQSLIHKAPNALMFDGARYWSSSDVDSRRDGYLAAGGLLAAALLAAAGVLGRWQRAQAPARAATPA